MAERYLTITLREQDEAMRMGPAARLREPF
jgi:hypothetical protein